MKGIVVFERVHLLRSMEKISIAVLDTYVDTHCEAFCGNVHMKKHEEIDTNIPTHGTAICSTIIRQCENVSIHVYPIFRNSMSIESRILLAALQEIYSTSMYDIILMSLGTDSFEVFEDLEEICEKFRNKGTILVSAFNNFGGLSIPAAFDTVVGVDVSELIDKPKDFYYIQDNAINVLCSNRPHMVTTNSRGDVGLMAGTSISAAYICGHIAKGMWDARVQKRKFLVHEFLKNTSKRTLHQSVKPFLDVKQFYGKRIALFPFQKETEAVAYNADYLKCKLQAIYDFPHSKYRNTSVAFGKEAYINIESCMNIDWKAFDILVMGHFDQYIRDNDHLANIVYQIALTAQNKGKLIYSFDGRVLEKYQDINVILPRITEEKLRKLNRGRLWNVPIPTVAVVGTGSRQGKFSTLIRLRSELIKKGINASMISTEPSGPLFHADFTFPYGFGSEVKIKVEDYPIIINQMLYEAYRNKSEVVLMELQSAIIGKNGINISQNMCVQDSILFGLNPDAHIIIVYPNDEMEYIRSTNTYMESRYQSTLVGILVFPFKYAYSENGSLRKENMEPSIEYMNKLRDEYKVSIEKMEEESAALICESLLEALTQ